MQQSRAIGHLKTIEGAVDDAGKSYSEAVRIVRSITHWPALTGILSARGQWMARTCKDADAARIDLEEALEYAITGGYRLYEADVYTGLAWASYADGNFSNTQNKANQAMDLSRKIGYFLGLQRATEVIQAIKHRT